MAVNSNLLNVKQQITEEKEHCDIDHQGKNLNIETQNQTIVDVTYKDSMKKQETENQETSQPTINTTPLIDAKPTSKELP